MRLKAIIFTVIGVLGNYTYAQRTDSFIYLKIENNNEVSILNQSGEELGEFISKYRVKESKVSEDNELIAIHEVQLENNYKTTLFLVSKEGEILNKFENVRVFDWDKSSSKLAFVTGDYYEGGIGYTPEGVTIYDVKSKTKFSISGLEGVDPYQIAWSMQDDVLFIKGLKGLKVYSYNLESAVLELTQFYDFNFSPDGKYYFQREKEIWYIDFGVFDMETNERLAFESKTIDGHKLVGWLPGNPHTLCYKKIIETKDVEVIELPKKDPNDLDEPIWTLEKYSNRKITGMEYKFYNVISESLEGTLSTDGTEKDLTTNNQIMIYVDSTENIRRVKTSVLD